MKSGIELLRLRCPKCSVDLPGRTGERFLFCGSCASGFELNKEEELVPVAVYFGRLRNDSQNFYPFWAFDARLEIDNREARSGITSFFSSTKGLTRIFTEREALRFYISGSTADLEKEKPVSLELTEDQPEIEFIQPLPKVTGMEINQNDARKIADYLFLLSEISQRDMLRTLKYRLQLDNPCVIVIGF